MTSSATYRFQVKDLLAEMDRANVRPARYDESGWYWTSLDGRRYWVTTARAV